MPLRTALCWVRRDLRLSDHAALAHATANAERTAVVFVFDRCILDALVDRDDRRLTFIHRSLAEMDAGLRARDSRLVVAYGDPVEEIPRLAAAMGAEAVFANRDYEPYAIERDRRIAERVPAFETFKDQVVFQSDELRTGSGGPFRVYSPFMRAWRARFRPETDAAERTADLGRLLPGGEAPNGTALEDFPLARMGFEEAPLWLEPGEAAGQARLSDFAHKIDRYGEDRNAPALDGTSGLSVHLRFGTVSVRAAVRHALAASGKGAEKWLNEVIWRDFYQAILAEYPQVVESTFDPRYATLAYPGDEAHFEAWTEGQTGYPIVDAAMRCLNATGWMHNRLRMIVASFLTKDLLIDYRRGEAYFARRLLDFDLASNNGGWQWAASTGCDPQPYFRIFNPVLQSKSHDPEGAFIRQWCPELGEFAGDRVHWPHDASPMEQMAAGCVLGEDYPHPIVDHAVQRERAVELLASCRDAAALQ